MGGRDQAGARALARVAGLAWKTDDPDISPLYADLTDMPSALFSCGTLDPLLDDTLFMAARWQAAGNGAQLEIYPGAPHEFLTLSDPINDALEARHRMTAFTDRVLSDQTPTA